MSDITVINDSQQSELVTNGLAKNGELYLKAAGSTDAGAIVVYDSGSWRTFADEAASFANNYSLEFDAVDDGLKAGSSFQLSGSSAWTVSFWIQQVNWSNDNRNTWSVFNSESSGYTGNSYFQYSLQFNGVGSILVVDSSITAANNSKGTAGYAWSSMQSYIPATAWNHFAYTNDGSGTRKLYANNNLVATITGCTGDFFADGTWIYGKPTTHNNLKVRMDEIALIPSDLSGSMSDLYNSGVAGDLSSYSPTNWWRMEDGSGSTVTDEGSAGNDATIQNQASFSSDTPS